jgi:hypothetical protein
LDRWQLAIRLLNQILFFISGEASRGVARWRELKKERFVTFAINRYSMIRAYDERKKAEITDGRLRPGQADLTPTA